MTILYYHSLIYYVGIGATWVATSYVYLYSGFSWLFMTCCVNLSITSNDFDEHKYFECVGQHSIYIQAIGLPNSKLKCACMAGHIAT